MKQKIQILSIHGGMTFKNNKDYLGWLKNKEISLKKRIKWSESYLDKSLGNDFQIIRPQMPLQENAKYRDWSIHFQQYLPLIKNNVILIGRSLGGIFLAKYLSENKFPKKILATYLVCPPFDNTVADEDLVGGFKLKLDLSLIEKNSPNLTLLFSSHDNVVPLAHAKKYANKLPKAKIIIYKHIKGHFQISKFPEIVKMIKKVVKKK